MTVRPGASCLSQLMDAGSVSQRVGDLSASQFCGEYAGSLGVPEGHRQTARGFPAVGLRTPLFPSSPLADATFLKPTASRA